MAKNASFAHALLMGTMLKISIKFNIRTCLVPCNEFHVGQVTQFHSVQECWKQLKILSVRRLGLIAI